MNTTYTDEHIERWADAWIHYRVQHLLGVDLIRFLANPKHYLPLIPAACT